MRRTLTPALLAFGAASLLAGRARATDCTDTTSVPNPYYLVGSTAIGPVVEKIAAYLATQPTPITIVYGGVGSCAGVSDIVNTVISPSTAGLVTPTGKSNYFVYFDSTGTQQACDLYPPDGGQPVYLNIALSDVFADSCQTLPQSLSSLGITERLGPVQAMTFAVPNVSTQKSISREAAYMTYGFGAKDSSVVTPWPDIMSMFQRGATSGTQTMIAKAIGVPSTQWFGPTPSGTPGMVAALTTANTAMNANAIGILGAADVDLLVRQPAITAGMTPPVRELAYQHSQQNCGYLPDSGQGSFDKQNVRDGHYAIWGPLHVFTLPHTDPNIDAIVNYLTGFAQVGKSLDVIAAEAQVGLIPQCAMRVTRTTEMGDLAPATTNTAPCSCYFEKSVFNGSTACTKCASTGDCPANYSCQTYGGQGYCEPPI